MALIVMKLNYPGLTADQLTNEQKEHIRAIATLASGLVGAATGNSFEAATTAAAAGYSAAVNNQMAGNADFDFSGFEHNLGNNPSLTGTTQGQISAAFVVSVGVIIAPQTNQFEK